MDENHPVWLPPAMRTLWFPSLSLAEPALPGAERAVRQGQRSQGVPGTAAQHGPADPGIGSNQGRKPSHVLRCNCVPGMWWRGRVFTCLIFYFHVS